MLQNPLGILLVDDDTNDLMFIRQEFNRNKVANPLYTAGNGHEALNMLRGTNGVQRIDPTPRIILLDLNMPEMGGLEFLKELSSDAELCTINVFVLSGIKDDRAKVEAHNYNVAGYINKPVTVERFIEAVTSLRSFWQLCYNDNSESKLLVVPNRLFREG